MATHGNAYFVTLFESAESHLDTVFSRPTPHPRARQLLASAWGWVQGTACQAAALAVPSSATRGGAFLQHTLTMLLTLAAILSPSSGSDRPCPP
jgi:hypothetical protein